MKKKVYIFRHGQTDWNIEKRVQGWSDIPLNDVGRKEAKSLAKKVGNADIEITKIFSSDFKRAFETAQILGSVTGAEIEVCPEFREANLGITEGKPLVQVKEEYGEAFWENSTIDNPGFWDFAYPEGESRMNLAQRFLKKMDRIDLNNFAISTHGGAIRIILTYLMSIHKKEIEFIKIPNCALYELVIGQDHGDFSYTLL